METLHYVVPTTSYPRYDYSKRHVASAYKRFGILMKHLNLDGSGFVLPEYGDVDVFVTRGSKTKEYVYEHFLELKHRENVNVKTKGKRIFNDLEDLMKRKEINGISPKIVIVCVSSVSEIKPFRKYPHNVVIVAEEASVVDKIQQTIANTDAVTTRKTLGQTICLLLERIVFRNLRDVYKVLMGLSEAAKNRHISNIVTDNITETMKQTLRNTDCFSGWIEELDEKNICALDPELANYKPTATAGRLQGGAHSPDKSSQTIKIEGDKNLLVPEYLKSVPNIEEMYTRETQVIYFLVYKLATHIGIITEQFVYTEYRKLPPILTDILRLTTDRGAIQTTITQKTIELFVTYIDRDRLDKTTDSAKDFLLKCLRSKTQHIMRAMAAICEQLELVKTVDSHQDALKEVDCISITRLLGDIMGLYNRSKVPQFERPVSKLSERRRMNEKVAQTLFKSVTAAIGCGYRYNKLHIYVEETDDKDDKVKVEKIIRKILVHNNISEYIVVHTSRVTHFKQVGAKIKVCHNGTLGCFANMGQEKTLCALQSQHVVNGASVVYLVDGDIKIGCMIQSPGNANVNVGYVDVAAAKILDEKREECVTQFKDSLNNPLPSRLFLIDDDTVDELEGLPVHICGASTELGTGTITVPEYHVPGMEKPLVLIEDIEGIEGEIHRFSAMGDSGAVVCADDLDGDYVNVISMLIGCHNYKEIEDNPATKGIFMTFRMTSALQYLEYQTGEPFTLCG